MRKAVANACGKYLARAPASIAALNRPGVSPHTFRHTRAMHLLQANVPLVTIKDVLGHADVKSTEVYVQIDLAMKREALTGSDPRPRRCRRRAVFPKTSSAAGGLVGAKGNYAQLRVQAPRRDAHFMTRST